MNKLNFDGCAAARKNCGRCCAGRVMADCLLPTCQMADACAAVGDWLMAGNLISRGFYGKNYQVRANSAQGNTSVPEMRP